MKKIYDIDTDHEAEPNGKRFQMFAEDPFEILKYLLTHDVDRDCDKICIKECECKYGYFPFEETPKYKEVNPQMSDDPWERWRVSVCIRPEERFSYYDIHEVISQTKADAILEAVRRMRREHPDATPLTEITVRIERNDRIPMNFSI